MKAVVTPVLMGGASFAGRRFGHHVGGWLVALPLTSGPVAFFLAADQGTTFAAAAAVGMLAGTISQVAFALAYSAAAKRGTVRAVLAGCAAFAGSTAVLSTLHWSAIATFALVCGALAVGCLVALRRPPQPFVGAVRLPRWEIPVRMVAATTITLLITTLAPELGAHVAGLLSPFPVFASVLAVSTHQTYGVSSASQALDGLLLGLFAPAAFFIALALLLPVIASASFAVAAAAALAAQGLSILAMPGGRQANH